MKKFWKNKAGFTLVELVVSFALLALFCVATVSVISASLGIYRSASARARGQLVAQTLLDRIAGELSGAQPGAESQYGITVSDGSGASEFAAGACVDLYNSDGKHLYITQRDGYLCIRERERTGDLQLDRCFDENVYNGFVIGGLKFSVVRSNVLCVQLLLWDTKSSYKYESECCVQCYSFDSSCVSRIVSGAVLPDS